MRYVIVLLTAPWVLGQITKDQIYELVEHNVSTATVVAMIQANCVDFEPDGTTIVELTTKVPSAVLKAIVDCPNGTTMGRAPAARTQTLTATQSAGAQAFSPASAVGFEASNYVTVELTSNKSTFFADEIKVRVVPAKGNTQEKWEYQSSGLVEQGGEKRCFKVDGATQMIPGDYIVYYYALSSRKTGMLRKVSQRTDLFRIHMSIDGPGPLNFTFHSEEEKGLSSDEAVKLTIRGPVTVRAEDHVQFEDNQSFANIENLFK